MAGGLLFAQKPRPDAFPPAPDTLAPKALTMATTLEEMYQWNRYPTYNVYIDMMRDFADRYPELCHLDTIGLSIEGRLILSLAITGSSLTDVYRPEFLYSSTMHGDEITGFYLMLRLCDTLLRSYGTSPEITSLLNTTRIYINPLSNPDGTYHGGDSTVAGAWRYNSDMVDLNRNYPDPFGTPPLDSLQPENQAMIAYVEGHNFLLSANLHGGSEVMNYPWDSFTSASNPHPASDWWQAVCKRFVDTARVYSNSHFRDVTTSGYIAGGDWYVIDGGRQDYVNYYHNCLEMTMEISTRKTLSSDRLPEYWQFLAPSFINYIDEIHNLPDNIGISTLETERIAVFPNPATDRVTVTGLPEGSLIELYDASGRLILITHHSSFIISNLPSGLYLLRTAKGTAKILKQ